MRAIGAERLWLLGVLTGGHFVIHWFQQFFPVILPSIKSGLNLNNLEVGALSSAQQLMQGVAPLPLGMIADSMVRHRTTLLALSLVIMGAAYFLLGVPVFIWALAGSGLLGLGTAFWHPAAAAALSNQFPERRATALSIHGTGATISDTVTPFCVGFLLANFSWQAAAQLQVIPGLLFAFVMWRALGAFAGARSRSARALLQLRDVVALVTNTAFLGVSAATGLLQMGRLVILTFMPVYLQEHLHYSPVALGGFVALLHAMGIISQPVLGLLSDRFGRKAVLVAVLSFAGFVLHPARACRTGPTFGARHRSQRAFFLYALQCPECRGHGCGGFEHPGIDLRPHHFADAAHRDPHPGHSRLSDRRNGNSLGLHTSRSVPVYRRAGTRAFEALPRNKAKRRVAVSGPPPYQ